MKITGELLKSERTRKNLSVQDIAFALKLSSKMITSIEAGQTENLPAKTFIRGFVKSYAQFLKMDADQVMRQFQEEMGTTHPLPKNPPPPLVEAEPLQKRSAAAAIEKPEKIEKFEKKTSRPQPAGVLNSSKSNRSLVYIGIAVVLVILIVGVNRIVDRYQREAVVDPTDVSKVQPLNPNTTQAPAATETTSISSNAPSLSLASSDSSQTQVTVSTDTETAKQTAVVAPMAQLEPDDGFELSIGKPVEVIIEAKKDVEIMYARGNTKNFSKIKLLSKQLQVIRSPAGLYLKSEDGGAFHLVVNGVDKGVAGSANKPVKLSF